MEKILGHIVGTTKPWTAQSPDFKYINKEQLIDHRIRAGKLKRVSFKQFKIYLLLDNGMLVYAPEIDKIRIENTKFGHCKLVAWYFKNIKLVEPIKIIAIYLIDDLGYSFYKKELNMFYNTELILPPLVLEF